MQMWGQGMVNVLDLPDDGGAEAACSSVSKGLVMHVDKCIDHDHWIHLHSLDRWEAEADGIYHVIAHDGAFVESDTWIRLAAAMDVDIEAESSISLHAGNVIDITADAFARSLSPYFIFGLDTPFQDNRDGILQLLESPRSGIYLGNTNNPAKKVLDWYEEDSYAVAWSAGGAAIMEPAAAGFTRIGNLVAVHVRLTIATNMPDGVGPWEFSLPYQPDGEGYCGAAVLIRNGLPRAATALIEGGAVRLLTRTPAPGVAAGDEVPPGRSDDAYVATATPGDSPAGWSSGDTLSFSVVYAVA